MNNPLSPPYTYELIDPDFDGKRHWRVRDGADNRVATCYTESNAQVVSFALNLWVSFLELPDTDRLLTLLKEVAEHSGVSKH